MKKGMILFFVLAVVMTACQKEEWPGVTANVKMEVAAGPDESSVTIRFIPNEETAYFDYAIGTESDLSYFEDGSLEGIQRQQGSEAFEATFSGLEQNTVYAVFARAYADNGNAAGVNVFKVYVSRDGLDVQMRYLTDVSAGFRIDCIPEYAYVRYFLGSTDDKDAFLSGEEYGEEVAEIDEYCGVNFLSLDAETDYVFYAIGTDRFGIESELFEIPFKTLRAGEFADVSISADIDIYSGTYAVTPNEHCGKYIVHVNEEGVLSSMLNGSFRNDIPYILESWCTLGEWSNNTYVSENGSPMELTLVTKDMVAGAPIDAYVSTYDKDGNLVGVKYYGYSTPAFDESLALPGKVSISVTNVSEAGATYIYTADDPNILGYFYETVEADWYDDIMENDPSWNEYYLADTFWSNYEESGMFHYGTDEFIWAETGGQSDFRYYAAAVPVNGNGPVEGGWGEVALEEYTTLAK